MRESLSRRAFLSRMWQWGAGIIAAAGAWTSWDLLRPGEPVGFGGKVTAVEPRLVPSDGVLEIPGAQAFLTKIEDEVVALWWKCPHLGCRVPWCDSSGQFECPCHGSDFNRAGEVRGGPAPRGMDRFQLEEVDGVLVIDTGAIAEGAPPGTESIDEPPRGPSCGEAG